MTEMQPGVPYSAPPVCPRHPDTVAYVKCQRCERPTCPQCQVPAPVGVLCVDCAREAKRAVSQGRNSLGFKRGGTPLVTYALLAANIAFFLYGSAVGSWQWQITYGLVPSLGFEEPWRLVTSAFVHGGFLHIAINMFMLFQFGTQLERILGSARFAVLYGVSLLGGSAAILALGGDNTVHVGASGAIFGLFAAYGVLLYKLKLQWQAIAIQAGLWLVLGFMLAGILWEGHLGGAVAGAATALVMLGLKQRQRS